MVRVSMAEFRRIKQMASQRKAKRADKRATLARGGFLNRGRGWAAGGGEKTRLKGNLDALWAFLVKLRDRIAYGSLCRICGAAPIEVAYHIVPRGNMATRWDPECGAGACSGCNWWELKTRQQRPNLVRERHIKIFGLEKIERLEAKARTTMDCGMESLHEISKSLKRQIENIKDAGSATWK